MKIEPDRSRPPRILIGIVSRNRAAILPKALDSARHQSASHTTIAVIDDASSDGTPALQNQYSDVEWTIRLRQDGLMSARSEFMSREEFDYFVSLDDDAWFLVGDEIEYALRCFNADPKLAVVAFDILSPDKPEQRERTGPKQSHTFVGCGHMVRVSAARQVGLYAPAPGGYGAEENDLSLRLLDAGWGLVIVPGVHVWHDKTPVARDLYWQHRSGVCNDLVMATRRTPLWILPAVIGGKVISHLVFAQRRNLLKPCLAGFGLYLRSQPLVWKWRRPVRLGTLRSYAALARA
jgi:GT2 family glycosyltransferase